MLVSWTCSVSLCPVSVSREQSVCLAPSGFLPIFPLCQTEEGGSGKLLRAERGQQRKWEKYIFLSRRSPSKAPCTFFGSVSVALLFSPPRSLCPSLNQPLILLLLPHTRSLIPNLFFPLYQFFFSIVLPGPLSSSLVLLTVYRI